MMREFGLSIWIGGDERGRGEFYGKERVAKAISFVAL